MFFLVTYAFASFATRSITEDTCWATIVLAFNGVKTLQLWSIICDLNLIELSKKLCERMFEIRANSFLLLFQAFYLTGVYMFEISTIDFLIVGVIDICLEFCFLRCRFVFHNITISENITFSRLD